MKNLVLLIVPLFVIVFAMLFGYVVPTLRRRKARHRPIAVVTFGAREAQRVLAPRPTRDMPVVPSPASAFAPPTAAVQAPPPLAPRHELVSAPTEELDAIPEHSRAVMGSTAVDRGRVLRMPIVGDRREGRDDGHATLRLERPAEGTLQFLPGKLEVVEGRHVGQEIRFVRTAGPDGTTVTFGRSEGPPYRHIQLQEQTVSRQHAKMWLDGKAWNLSNLSATNPVVLNGQPLADLESVVTLRDGDRIEMGEVVLRFRVK